MAEPYIGEIRMFAGNFAPVNYAFCNGQLLAIQQNSALFSILGTTYGGNGTSNFALPNLQGRTPIHWGQGPGLTNRVIGEMGGEASVTLNSSTMPMHNHVLNATATPAPTPAVAPSGTVWAQGVAGHAGATKLYASVNTNPATMGQDLALAGGNQPHNNESPYLAINFIIALYGAYPSRN